MGGEVFVFKGFELGGNEAFGVFEGLTALVVGGGVFGLGFAEFYLEAVYAVVF